MLALILCRFARKIYVELRRYIVRIGERKKWRRVGRSRGCGVVSNGAQIKRNKRGDRQTEST